MNNRAFFDIHDNELIASYLHLPITRDRQFWEKSVIELYQFILSRVEREQLKLTEDQLEYLMLKMLVDNGSSGLYMPFKRKTINQYISDYRGWLSIKDQEMYVVHNEHSPFIRYFNSVNSPEFAPGSKIKSLRGHESLYKWHYLLIPLIDSLLNGFELITHKLNESEIWECINLFLEEMGTICGGRSIYLSGQKKIRNAIRDNLVFNEFNGANVNELARKYRISDQWVYTAIRKQRKYRLKLVS